MFPIDGLLLTAALLLLAGIVLSKLSARIGVPVLVLFIGLGMLAGSEGPGRIAFENYAVANGIGTLALVFILFDGALRTSVDAFRMTLAPALSLATVGVVLTALITGLAAWWLLDLPWTGGLLLGSIVGSTDAAAVFAVLRSKGLHLQRRVSATLEVESGSNDPMAVFLTVCLAEIAVGAREPGFGVLGFFGLQALVGTVAGVAVGFCASGLVKRIQLGSAGLYPVLTGTTAVLAYGLAAALGGSGFLAVYLAGIVFGNRRTVFQRGIFLFHDGLAWLSQIAMFIVLGLLSFPSRVVAVAAPGLLLAAVLVLVARPLAVAICLGPFRYSWREIAFVSWVGLRGAVPIVLATFPLLTGYAAGTLIFDIVFFVVLFSASVQGWTVPLAARLLGLDQPAPPRSPITLEIASLHEVGSDIVDYSVSPDSVAAGLAIRELSLPDDVVVAMVVRGDRVIPARGSTRIAAGDHVFLVVPAGSRDAADRGFGGRPAASAGRRDGDAEPV